MKHKNTVGVDISFSFALMLALVLLLDFSGVAAMSLAAAAVHECGHLIAMAALGRRPQKIIMRLSGVYIIQNSGITSACSDAIVAASGPAANFICAAALLIAEAVWTNDAAALLGCAMIVMGAFNLMPISGLDGGDLLRIFAYASFSAAGAAAVTKWSTIVFAALMVIAGVVAFFAVGNGWLALIGVYIMLFSLFPHGKKRSSV